MEILSKIEFVLLQNLKKIVLTIIMNSVNVFYLRIFTPRNTYIDTDKSFKSMFYDCTLIIVIF